MSTSPGPGFHGLWPTPFAIERFAAAAEINPVLARVFGAMRAAAEHASSGAGHGHAGEGRSAFFASDDDLLQRIDLPEWHRFVQFVVDRLQATMARANEGVWPPGRLGLRVEIAGMWFQASNAGAGHDLHNHGNCSWSGVYCVQVDPAERRSTHPVYGERNGCTRFYGPYLNRLGGAHVDMGNAYLQRPHLDIAPEPGTLVVFPSWLEHQALPYAGELDRIIVSFNAALHRADGNDRLFGYAAN